MSRNTPIKSFIAPSLVGVLFLFLSGCELILTYSDTRSKCLEFMDAVLKEKYEKCIDLMPVSDGSKQEKDSLAQAVKIFKENLNQRLGPNLQAVFLSTLTYREEESGRIKDHELGYVQLINDTCYAKIQMLLDDSTAKIRNIKVVAISNVPEKTNFYFFNFIGSLVLVINLVAIRAIWRFQLTKKGLWIIAVLLLNYPTLTFTIQDGPLIDYSRPQLFGWDFSYKDVSALSVIAGLPLGALIAFVKIKMSSRIS